MGWTVTDMKMILAEALPMPSVDVFLADMIGCRQSVGYSFHKPITVCGFGVANRALARIVCLSLLRAVLAAYSPANDTDDFSDRNFQNSKNKYRQFKHGKNPRGLR